MTLVSSLLALGLMAGPAEAKKKDVGVRLKVSSDLFAVESDKVEYDGSVQDGSETRRNTISLFEYGQRLEATYFLGEGFEIGGMLGFTQQRGTAGDDEIPASRHAAIYLTGAYNVGLGSGVRFYAQPIVGVDRSTAGLGEDGEAKLNYLVGGAGAGIRTKLSKKITFDTGAEALIRSGTTSLDGESDDKLKLKGNKLGLRLGLSVRF